MSSKEFCESGQHVYREVDIVRTIFLDGWERKGVSIVVACSKCDSKFLRQVTELP